MASHDVFPFPATEENNVTTCVSCVNFSTPT